MPRIDMLTSELHALLVPVLPHASTEKDDPAGLNVVRFEIHNGVLYTIATDRYTMAAHRHPLDEDTDDFAVSIGRDHAANLLKTFKHTRKTDPKLTIILDEMTIPGEGTGPGIRVDSEDHARLLYGAAQLGDEPAPFPNWKGRFAAALARPLEPVSPLVALSGPLMARWAKANPGEGVRLFRAPEKKTVLIIAGDTMGLQAVVLDRGPADELAFSPWTGDLKDVEPIDEKPKPAAAEPGQADDDEFDAVIRGAGLDPDGPVTQLLDSGHHMVFTPEETAEETHEDEEDLS